MNSPDIIYLKSKAVDGASHRLSALSSRRIYNVWYDSTYRAIQYCQHFPKRTNSTLGGRRLLCAFPKNKYLVLPTLERLCDFTGTRGAQVLPPHGAWVTKTSAGREYNFNGYCYTCSTPLSLLPLTKTPTDEFLIYVWAMEWFQEFEHLKNDHNVTNHCAQVTDLPGPSCPEWVRLDHKNLRRSEAGQSRPNILSFGSFEKEQIRMG